MMKILRWFFGLGWLIGGLGLTTDVSVVGGLLVALAGLLLLPPTFPFIVRATGQELSKPIKYASVIVLLGIGCAIVFPKQEQKALAEKKEIETKAAEKKKQEQLAYARLSPAAKDSIKRAAEKEARLAQVQQARAAEYASKKERREKIESLFSAYDGSQPAVERAIKDRMNDPDSYEHVATRFSDKGSYVMVYTQFRGRNAFNAKIMSVATAKIDLSGHLVDLQM